MGTVIIDCVIRALKETEMETAPEEWQRAWVAHEYANGFFARSMNPTEAHAYEYQPGPHEPR